MAAGQGTAGHRHRRSDDLPLSGVDVSIGALSVFGRAFKELRIGATRAAAEWQIDLQGRELMGNARWQAAATGRPNGRLVARLQKVVAPGGCADRDRRSPSPKIDAPPAANPWPALDIIADSFTVKNHELGKLELVAQPHEADWQIENLKVSNDDGTLTAAGWWRNTRSHAADRTRRRSGRARRGRVPGALRHARRGARRADDSCADNWRGRAARRISTIPTLNGAFSIETGRGPIHASSTLASASCSVSCRCRRSSAASKATTRTCSARGLLRRNHRQVRIKDGVMRTDDLKIVGPSARVDDHGRGRHRARDAEPERARAADAVGQRVGRGGGAVARQSDHRRCDRCRARYLAQKIMQDPIEKMFSQRYVVTGSWSDPQVERGSAAAPTPSIMGGGK